MPHQTLEAEAGGLPDTRPTPAEATRWGVARSVVTSAVRAGLVVGLVFGLGQAFALACPHRSYMILRQWADVLTFSSLWHGLFWAVYAGGVALACALAVLVSRRIRRAVNPGALAAGIVSGGVITFLIWVYALFLQIPLAEGMNLVWWLAMVGCWVIVIIAGGALARLLVGTWVARWTGKSIAVSFWPALVVLLGCAAVQWYERPKLLEPTTAWKQASSASAERGSARPNVVLVVLDTQRIDRLGCYGYGRPTTPRLDAFAADALVFEHCIAPSIWTLPCHASLFTGLFPSEHGTTWNHRWLDEHFDTMAELLDALGYQTACFTNNVWITPGTNLSQGFDDLVRPVSLHRARGNSISAFFSGVLAPAGLAGKRLGFLSARDEGAKFTNQLVARWLDDRDVRRPFFLFINYLEPHWAYRPHLPHRRLFVNPKELNASYRHNWRAQTEFLVDPNLYTPAELKILNDVYDAETRVLDDHVGEFLEVLGQRVPLDNTLVIITSDHGENLGDHNLLEHAWCVYDTLSHVALIIRWPKRLRPGRNDELVQLTDLLPTVMDAVRGHPVRTASTFGRSLLPPAEGATSQPRDAGRPRSGSADGSPESRVAVVERIVPKRISVTKLQRLDLRFNRAPYMGILRAIRQGPWKYIIAADGREELYHVIDDPGEAKNQIKTHRPIASHLSDLLREWLAASRPYRPPSQLKGDARRMDDETHNRLRSLGYIQ